MKLTHREIPVELLRKLPAGIKIVNRGGEEFLVIEDVRCSQGHSLAVDSVRIHGEPSIKLHVKVKDDEGSIFVDAFWGSHAKLFSFLPSEVSGNIIVEASCPTCGESLMEKRECVLDDCESTDSILLRLPNGRDEIHVCGRLGCPGHEIKLAELPAHVSNVVSEINFFGARFDEMFGDI